MGVPKFFRWVTNRYPSILTNPLTGPPTEPNVDNLYLDMNGVIHQCSHTDADISEDLPFDVVCKNIFDEINRIVNLVRPQQLIYIAVDGVAPRAKLNQQRARRFRSSHERILALNKSGSSPATSFDSNCITPGTEFMARLSEALRAFIAHMLQTQVTWHGLKVHFSGSEVPGEGEHKIISFIRQSRSKDDYLPNQRHCILGADADMIMLALATHEPYFLVLRDVLDFKRPKKPFVNGNHITPQADSPKIRSMNYIRINVLREYLVNELLESLNPAEFDAERIIDDFVFLTFLVGNDFLPHLPAINIGDDAFELIFDAYKTVLASDPGYLVHEGVLNIERLELIFTLIGVTEKSLYYDQVFMAEQKERQAKERKEKAAKYRAEKLAAMNAVETASFSTQSSVGDGSLANELISGEVNTNEQTSQSSMNSSPALMIDSSECTSENVSNLTNTVSHVSLLDREEQCKHDYYVNKFGIDINTSAGQTALREIVSAYLLGLQWCLQYYTIGCTSWEWFYPYHYGPFLQDMTHLATVSAYIDAVQLGNPLQPFQQLLACLPAASCTLLPAPYHALMTSAASPLYEFYPAAFETDLNGKKQDYEAVVILPFIDIAVLKQAEADMLMQHGPLLTTAELKRNTFGLEYIYSMHTLTQGQVNNGSTGLHGDTLCVETIPFTLPCVAEMKPFSSVLVPGTVNPETSIPGFPSRTKLLEVVNYTKGYGKSKKSQKNIRSRANCYNEETTEAFPMPGIVGNGSWNSHQGKQSDSIRVHSISVQSTQVESADNKTEDTSEHVGGVLRLINDSRTNQILHAIAQQVHTQCPSFHPFNHSIVNDDTQSATEPTATFATHIDLPLYSFVGVDNVPQYASLLLNNNILQKASTIFGPIKCTLQPVALLSHSLVSIKFVDVSHLNQLEDFLLQRLLGIELLDTLNRSIVTKQSSPTSNQKLEHAFVTKSGSNGVTKNKQGASGVGFSRSIVIGSYTGDDSERFMEWLNKELYKLSALLTNLSCEELQYVGCDEERKEVVKVCVHLSG